MPTPTRLPLDRAATVLCRWLVTFSLAAGCGEPPNDAPGPRDPEGGQGGADTLSVETAGSVHRDAMAAVSLMGDIAQPLAMALQSFPEGTSFQTAAVVQKNGITVPLQGACFRGGNASVTNRPNGVTVTLSQCIGRAAGQLPVSGNIDISITDFGSNGLLLRGDGTLDLTTSEGATITGSFYASVDFARVGQVIVRLGDLLDTDQLSISDGARQLASRIGCFELVVVFEQGQRGLELLRITPLGVASRLESTDALDKTYTINDFASNPPFVAFDSDGQPRGGDLTIHSGDRSTDDDDRTQACLGFGSAGDGSFASALFSPGGCIELSGEDRAGDAFSMETNWGKLLSGDLSEGGGVPCGAEPPVIPPVIPPVTPPLEPPVDPNLRQHVMAVAPREPGATLEVWVSRDGLEWAGPVYPLLRDCDVPVEIDRSIAPALGATSTHYLAAAYDVNGTLYFSKSRDGIHWESAVESITVDDLGSGSRPSVVFDEDNEAWFALVSQLLDLNGPPQYAMTMLDLDGVGSALSQVPTGLTTFSAPHIVHTGAQDREYMLTKTRNSGNLAEFVFYTELPDGLEDFVVPSILDAEDPVTSLGAFSSSSILDQILLVSNEDITLQGDVPLSVGQNRVWGYDVESDTWSSLFTVQPTAPSHEGAAIAGPLADLVVASPGRQDYTDVWHVDQRPSGFGFEQVEVPTRSGRAPAVAFGPVKGPPRPLDLCCEFDDPNCEILARNLFMRFRSFKRTIPPDLGDFGAAEDVELNVTVHSQLGVLKAEFDADPQTPGVQGLVVRNATQNQGHQFNEGDPGADLPTFRALVLPKDIVTVTLTGSEAGSSSVVIPIKGLAAPQGANAKNTRTSNQDEDPIYQLWYDSNALPLSTPPAP